MKCAFCIHRIRTNEGFVCSRKGTDITVDVYYPTDNTNCKEGKEE